jgi:hypothetical protein
VHHQKAIPLSLLQFMMENCQSDLQRATAPLLIVALYFCFRSCEYLQTPRGHLKKTKVIVLGGIRFFKNGRILPFHDPLLQFADFVSITFFDQKNGEKFQSVHVERAAVNYNELCCVHNLARVCQRIASYSHPTPILLRKISMYQAGNGIFSDITSDFVIKFLRSGAATMGSPTLGFQPSEIGTHSIRSGGAMAYYLLPGMSDSQVMFFGRWKSLAFLKYIRAQVDRFHSGFSTQIAMNPHFQTIPDLSPDQLDLMRHTSPDYLLFGAETARDARLRDESRATCL